MKCDTFLLIFRDSFAKIRFAQTQVFLKGLILLLFSFLSVSPLKADFDLKKVYVAFTPFTSLSYRIAIEPVHKENSFDNVLGLETAVFTGYPLMENRLYLHTSFQMYLPFYSKSNVPVAPFVYSESNKSVLYDLIKYHSLYFGIGTTYNLPSTFFVRANVFVVNRLISIVGFSIDTSLGKNFSFSKGMDAEVFLKFGYQALPEPPRDYDMKREIFQEFTFSLGVGFALPRK